MGTTTATLDDVCTTETWERAFHSHGAHLTDRTAAFLCGGRIWTDVHVDARTHLHAPPVLWLRGAAIDIDDLGSHGNSAGTSR